MLAHDRPPPIAEMPTTYAYLPVVIAGQPLVLLRNIVADNGNKCGAIETVGPKRTRTEASGPMTAQHRSVMTVANDA
jgi:hypothetical protein